MSHCSIIYEELIIFRGNNTRFSGIDMKLESQQSILDGKTQYDCLNFAISCWSDVHWDSLKNEWENNAAEPRVDFDLEGHFAKRRAAQIDYERQFWFDVTDVFNRY